MVSVCGHLSPCFQAYNMYKMKDIPHGNHEHNEYFPHKLMDLKPQSMIDGTVGGYRTLKIQSLARENTSQRADLGGLYHYLILCLLSLCFLCAVGICSLSFQLQHPAALPSRTLQTLTLKQQSKISSFCKLLPAIVLYYSNRKVTNTL